MVWAQEEPFFDGYDCESIGLDGQYVWVVTAGVIFTRQFWVTFILIPGHIPFFFFFVSTELKTAVIWGSVLSMSHKIMKHTMKAPLDLAVNSSFSSNVLKSCVKTCIILRDGWSCGTPVIHGKPGSVDLGVDRLGAIISTGGIYDRNYNQALPVRPANLIRNWLSSCSVMPLCTSVIITNYMWKQLWDWGLF